MELNTVINPRLSYYDKSKTLDNPDTRLTYDEAKHRRKVPVSK